MATSMLKFVTNTPPRRRGPSALTKEQRRKAELTSSRDVEEVYQFWCLMMRPDRTRVPVLDEKRRLKVAAAIADYGVDECMRAVLGCLASDFHQGRNKQKKRYDDLELIFRDQDHIERFLAWAPVTDDEWGSDT